MPNMMQFDSVLRNLLSLGTQRLIVLGIVGLALIATIGLGSYYLAKPDYVLLYTDLTQQDSSRIGGVLSEYAISYDVSTDGSKVSVKPADTARARMILAEKGLPATANSGNELFDKVGSMGLTSFMQQVTRSRALEGELARSIQTLRGVRAARVHIVIADDQSFRRERQKPSASVVVKFDNEVAAGSAKAIRHLVASAVPGMMPEAVQVVSTDGTVLTPDGDAASEVPSKMIELERAVSHDLQDRIRRALTPYLGSENFEVSVSAKVNMDKMQSNETAYDPKTRVERSTRVVRQADNSKNNSKSANVSVEQNIPGEEASGGGGLTSERSNDRREELINYEINTKTTSTESQGYRLERMTVAVLVNRKRLADANGSPVVAATLDERLKEVEALVSTSAGISVSRGDQVKVVAADFVDEAGSIEPASGPGIGEMLMGQVGSVIRSLTIIAVVLIVVMMGVRPLARTMLEQPSAAPAVVGIGGDVPAIASSESGVQAGLPPPAADSDKDLLDELINSPTRSVSKRLEKIVSLDEAQAAAILKQWLQQARA